MIVFKRDLRWNVPLEKRDFYGFDSKDIMTLKEVACLAGNATVSIRTLKKAGLLKGRKLKLVRRLMITLMLHATL